MVKVLCIERDKKLHIYIRFLENVDMVIHIEKYIRIIGSLQEYTIQV